MIFHIYCDESRQTKDRFMAIGGIIIPVDSIENFSNTIKKFREEQNMYAELKWTKVSSQKINEYKRFIDYFFALNNTDILRFHCIIIDNHQLNHRKFNKGDREIGFYKFYYQLLLHCFGKRYYSTGNNNRFIVNLDYRNSSYSLNTLKVILNRGLKKRYNIDTSPFVSIIPRDSKKSDIIQVADIILGAIGFQKNGYDLLSGSKTSKKELCEYIAQKAGLRVLGGDTPFYNQRFTIWNFQLKK
jgi:hypothetical protein